MRFEIDGRPFAQSVLGLPSMSDTNGFVFSKWERNQAGSAGWTNNSLKKSKPNKTPDDKKNLDRLKKTMTWT